MTGLEKSTETIQSSRAVLCAKCEHLNPPRLNVCERCGAHLHVVCHSCGHRNSRVKTRCVECNHRLHRSSISRVRQLLFGKNRKMFLIQAILLVTAILIGGALLYFSMDFSVNFRPPPEQ